MFTACSTIGADTRAAAAGAFATKSTLAAPKGGISQIPKLTTVKICVSILPLKAIVGLSASATGHNQRPLSGDRQRRRLRQQDACLARCFGSTSCAAGDRQCDALGNIQNGPRIPRHTQTVDITGGGNRFILCYHVNRVIVQCHASRKRILLHLRR